MILCLLPASDYDPTESAVVWHALTSAGIPVRFATPEGKPAHADVRLVQSGFKLLNPVLMTRKQDLALYAAMTRDSAFLAPQSYRDANPEDFDGLLVPGGHAAGMRSLLESERAQALTLHFFQRNKPVAAVCHGVLLLARTRNPQTGKSVLHGRKTTALTAINMELPAWAMTAPWLGNYYRTYPQTVESEVKAALASPDDFDHGPLLPIRDTERNHRHGFTVRDGNYLSARWPGDCHRFAKQFVALVQKNSQKSGQKKTAT